MLVREADRRTTPSAATAEVARSQAAHRRTPGDAADDHFLHTFVYPTSFSHTAPGRIAWCAHAFIAIGRVQFLTQIRVGCKLKQISTTAHVIDRERTSHSSSSRLRVAPPAEQRVETVGKNLPRLFADDALARRAPALAVDTAALLGAVLDVVPVAEVRVLRSQPNPTSIQALTVRQVSL